MTINRRFTYDETKITAIKVDQTTNFLWIAYEKNSDGICVLKKVSGFDPDQLYFDIDDIEVDKIVKIDLDSSNIYLAFDDSTLLGKILDQTNPLTTTTEISIPVGIVEKPVDVAVNDTDLFFLIPGNSSGTNAKILKYNTSGVFQETIDLTKTAVEVTNATSFAIADTGDIWVVTFNDPAEYVRVFQVSGGAYDFTIHQTI